MPSAARKPHVIDKPSARRIWLRAQQLDTANPFGDGPEATRLAVEHLGYVQIDTINVIERSHHHILYARIPGYQRTHLHHAQSVDKSVFEYWTHALSYVPTRDIPFFLGAMRSGRHAERRWFGTVTDKDLRRVLGLIRKGGPLTIRDIDDDVLVEKNHAWGSRKPSKRALQVAFYRGLVTVSARAGMLKTYELTDRHFGWEARPKAATDRQVLDYLLERALRAQGTISLDSICHLDARSKPGIRRLIEAAVRRKDLVPRVPRCWRRTRRPTANSFTSSRRSIRSSSSASAWRCSSVTTTASRPTCPRRSACSAISPCRFWSATRWSPPSTSRPTAPMASC
jgi:uncharacterized protein YcaQ